MCLFRTNPPQTTSDPGTALRPWSPSSHVAAANTRTGWSYSVKPGTHPPPSHPTHPKETSRLKCEQTSEQKTKLSYTRCGWSSVGRAVKDSVRVYRCEDRSQKKKLYSIFSHRDIKWTRGAGSVWENVFNKLFLRCLDFIPEKILFHLFDDLGLKKKSNISAPFFL